MWHLNLTKCCPCHEKWLLCLILVTYETSFPMRGATGVTIQPHQILRLPRKMTLQDFRENLQKQVKRHFQCGDDPRMIRAWSDHDPSMIRPWKRKPQPASPPRLLSSSPRAFSIEKYNVSRPILHSNLHQILRLPRKVTLALHEVLRLPRKVTLELHQVLHLPRKVHLNFTKYCACHCTVTELYCTLLYLTLLYLTLLYLTLLYLTLLYLTLLYLTLLYLTLLYWTLLYLTLLYLALLYLTLLYLTLLYLTLLYLTLLYWTLLYSTWLYSTWHYSTWHYSTWHYSTWHYLLNFTGMSFVYRKFLI